MIASNWSFTDRKMVKKSTVRDTGVGQSSSSKKKVQNRMELMEGACNQLIDLQDEYTKIMTD